MTSHTSMDKHNLYKKHFFLNFSLSPLAFAWNIILRHHCLCMCLHWKLGSKCVLSKQSWSFWYIFSGGEAHTAQLHRGAVWLMSFFTTQCQDTNVPLLARRHSKGIFYPSNIVVVNISLLTFFFKYYTASYFTSVTIAVAETK